MYVFYRYLKCLYSKPSEWLGFLTETLCNEICLDTYTVHLCLALHGEAVSAVNFF